MEQALVRPDHEWSVSAPTHNQWLENAVLKVAKVKHKRASWTLVVSVIANLALARNVLNSVRRRRMRAKKSVHYARKLQRWYQEFAGLAAGLARVLSAKVSMNRKPRLFV